MMKKTLLTFAVLAGSMLFIGSAEARCHSQASFSIGFGGFSVAHSFARPVYAQPVYAQPVYVQPYYVAPNPYPVYAYPAPVYSAPRPCVSHSTSFSFRSR